MTPGQKKGFCMVVSCVCGVAALVIGLSVRESTGSRGGDAALAAKAGFFSAAGGYLLGVIITAFIPNTRSSADDEPVEDAPDEPEEPVARPRPKPKPKPKEDEWTTW